MNCQRCKQEMDSEYEYICWRCGCEQTHQNSNYIAMIGKEKLDKLNQEVKIGKTKGK